MKTAPAGMRARAFSLLEIKSFDEDRRELVGLATTPEVDRVGDIVESTGAKFRLPIPLLWQHDSSQPIGQVTQARVTPAGIQITAQLVKVDEVGTLRDRLDNAWQSIKSGLVRGLSIGFRSLESTRIAATGGLRHLAWEWLELSAVTIAANASATIATVKAADARSKRRARAPLPHGSVRLITAASTKGVRLVPAKRGGVTLSRGSVKLIPCS